jgi:hypothetical protein
MNKDFDEEKVREILVQYPNLRIALKAGLISRRLCKDMLGITKWDMDDLYTDLIRYGAIKVLSSSAFRATEDTMNIIAQIDAATR